MREVDVSLSPVLFLPHLLFSSYAKVNGPSRSYGVVSLKPPPPIVHAHGFLAAAAGISVEEEGGPGLTWPLASATQRACLSALAAIQTDLPRLASAQWVKGHHDDTQV